MAGNLPAMDHIEDTDRKERRFERRAGRRVAIGLALGAIAGAIVAAVAGAMFWGVGTPAMWAATIAGAIFVGGVVAMISGLSGLESPRPGREPTATGRPLHDERTVVEYPEEAAEARHREPG
jgi:hypothetical protein